VRGSGWFLEFSGVSIDRFFGDGNIIVRCLEGGVFLGGAGGGEEW
jgi:hypothetical protein